MIRHATTARRWLSALAVIALPVWLASCDMTPQAGTSGHKPDIGIKSLPASGDDATAEAQTSTDTPVGALIHRVDMPLNVSLEASWAAVDEQVVPTLMHGMWQANGLRIGILHADQAQAFAQALPPILGESRAKLYTAHYPTAIRSTPRVINPVVIDLTAPPRSPTTYRAHDGRLQLLARIGRDESGQAWVELTPHHYKPKADLIPRSPLEKALDGRVFDTLSAMLPLSSDTAIVVGLYRPWTESEQATEELLEQTDTTSPPETPPGAESEAEPPTAPESNPPADVTEQAPPLPNHLGRSLMAGERAGKPTQMLLVISIIEEAPSSDAGESRRQ